MNSGPVFEQCLKNLNTVIDLISSVCEYPLYDMGTFLNDNTHTERGVVFCETST